MDYWNFSQRWEKHTKEPPSTNFRWDQFPQALLDELALIPYLAYCQREMRGVKVYSAVKASGVDGNLEQWLQEYVDQLPAYTVDLTVSDVFPVRCSKGHESPYYVEKGVDTKIAVDLLALAMRDLYDVGVLISNDTDLIPSIECVQNILDKHIVHLAFTDSTCKDVRSAAWGHLPLERMRQALEGPPTTLPRGVTTSRR